jgi:hypothetical protein
LRALPSLHTLRIDYNNAPGGNGIEWVAEYVSLRDLSIHKATRFTPTELMRLRGSRSLENLPSLA